MRFERDRLKGIQIMQSSYLSSVSTFGNLAFFNCLRTFCWISTIQSIMSLLAFLMAASIAIKWWRQYCNWGFLLGLRLCHVPGTPAIFVSLFCSDQICCFAPFFEFVGSSCKGERGWGRRVDVSDILRKWEFQFLGTFSMGTVVAGLNLL